MNKIVREHYPVENLPEDLREGLDNRSMVRVVIEVESDPSHSSAAISESGHSKLLTVQETLEMISKYKAEGHPSVSGQEAVERIRQLRDEWDY